MRKLALAAVLSAFAAAPAFAQAVVIQAPPGTYLPYPPAASWHHPGDWDRWDAPRRESYYGQWRTENWRCDHGDRAACGWIASAR